MIVKSISIKKYWVSDVWYKNFAINQAPVRVTFPRHVVELPLALPIKKLKEVNLKESKNLLFWMYYETLLINIINFNV